MVAQIIGGVIGFLAAIAILFHTIQAQTDSIAQEALVLIAALSLGELGRINSGIAALRKLNSGSGS